MPSKDLFKTTNFNSALSTDNNNKIWLYKSKNNQILLLLLSVLRALVKLVVLNRSFEGLLDLFEGFLDVHY